jgi:hypothetical protein
VVAEMLRRPTSPPVDWAIVLRELCVVDDDSPALVAELEARIPGCAEAQCERTPCGVHF